MQQKSDIEMERARITKIARVLIRLKHSLNADLELNRILPAQIQEFDAAVQNGELLALNEDFLREILEGK